MIKFLQINLGRGREAQDLLTQTSIEKGADILLISEQYRKPTAGFWLQDTTGRAAIAVPNHALRIGRIGPPEANFVWAEIEDMKVYSCYFSPNMPYDDFLTDLDNLEASLRSAGNKILVAGDFNSKSPEWGSKRLDKRGVALSEMMARLDLVVLNKGNTFTFRRGTTGSVIDIGLVSNDVAARVVAWKVLEDLTLSDHQYIKFIIEAASSKKKDSNAQPGHNWRRGGWVFRKLDEAQLIQSLETVKNSGNLQRMAVTDDPETLVKYAVETIEYACDASMPRWKKFSRAKKPVYWWTPEIAELRRKCMAARRRAQRAKKKQEHPNHEREYKNSRKDVRLAIKRSKRKCWEDITCSIDKDPWGLPYRIVSKKLVSRHPIPGISCPRRMREIVDTLFPTHEQRKQLPVQEGSLKIVPFSTTELQTAGNRLQPRKAPGLDNIPNEIIRMVIKVYPDLLLETFNACLKHSVFPARWKRQKLILLRKGDKPLSDPSSYRPICLIDNIGKLLERMILQRLEEHIKDHGGLSPRQYGFQKGRSTIDAITCVINTASKIRDVSWKNKGFCALVTLDISNAFNTARWEKIIDALALRQTPEYLMRMIDNYLSGRFLIYDTRDGPIEHEVSAGAAQGSVIGPFLWNIMYDGLLNLDLPDNSTIVGFADDAAVVVTARKTSTLEILVNETLRRSSKWLTENGLQIAPHKTEAVLITDRRAFTPPKIILQGAVVPWGKSLKYLGIQLDGKLRYTEHVTRTTEKAAASATALAQLMPNIRGPREMKRRLLNSVIHSKILYGAEIWADAMKRAVNRQRMASVQRRSVLRVISAYRTVSEEAALVLSSTPPIDLLVREKEEVYQEHNIHGGGVIVKEKKHDIKKRARQRLLARWQKRWDEATTGRWTHTLIPKIAVWLKRQNGEINYYLTQALTGHGCFNAYLERFKKSDTASCIQCGHAFDDARHTIFDCKANEEDRRNVEGMLGGTTISEVNLIAVMLNGKHSWEVVTAFIIRTMEKKEADERKTKENTSNANTSGN